MYIVQYKSIIILVPDSGISRISTESRAFFNYGCKKINTALNIVHYTSDCDTNNLSPKVNTRRDIDPNKPKVVVVNSQDFYSSFSKSNLVLLA